MNTRRHAARHLTRAILAIVSASMIVTGCSPDVPAERQATPQPVELKVSAAMTLKSAFERLADDFEKETGVAVSLNFGASGVLQKQIEGGAAVDVFASAAPKQMDALIDAGFVSAEDTATFASNRVVVLTRTGEAGRVSGAGDVLRWRRIATGNPESTPVGVAVSQWMEREGLLDRFEQRVIYGENVTQVMEYLSRGEVDAVVVFATEATGRDDVQVAYEVPAEATDPIRYVIAPLEGSAHREEATAFVEYVLSEKGRSVLAEAGFLLPERSR